MAGQAFDGAKHRSENSITDFLQAHPCARGGVTLFVRNTVASTVAFAIDMGLLWLLVEKAGLSRLLAATAGFLVAMTIHYIISRLWVFRGTERGVASGYVYFLANAGVGLVVTLGLFAIFIEYLGLHYLVARAISSVVAGLVVFFLNATLNFKALGRGSPVST